MITTLNVVIDVVGALVGTYVARRWLKGPSLPFLGSRRATTSAATPSMTTQAMADVGDPRKHLPDEARPIIRAIEDDARIVATTLRSTVGDERTFLAKETLARYLPDALAKYFAATHDVAEPAGTIFAVTLLRELAALGDGLRSVKDTALAEYAEHDAVDERFLRERFSK